MPYSISDFEKRFPDESACVEYIAEKRNRYKDVTCPSCKNVGQFYKNKGKKSYMCSCGSYAILPQKSTVFAGSRAGLKNWFTLVYLLSNSDKNLSMTEIMKLLHISQPTALSMQFKILSVMKENVLDEAALPRWEKKTISLFKNVTKEKRPYFYAFFQFREEQKTRGVDPFFHLLDLCIQ